MIARGPRQRRRNALLLAGLVPSLCCLAVAVALLVMLARDAAGRADVEDEQYAAAAEHFASNRWFGTVERWVAPYNEGVATFHDGRPADAIEDFAAALDLAPLDRECLVLHNVAVSWEALGDDAAPQDAAAAVDGYRRGRGALASADCLDRQDDGAGIRADSTVLDDRLRTKILALLDEQGQRELARLTEAERTRVERLESADERAAQRDQRPPEPSPEPEEDYAW